MGAAIEAWIDRNQVVRRMVLLIAIVMTWEVSRWAMWFAVDNSRDGIQIAAIIAAVTAPITLFASQVFKVYAESKRV